MQGLVHGHVCFQQDEHVHGHVSICKLEQHLFKLGKKQSNTAQLSVYREGEPGRRRLLP